MLVCDVNATHAKKSIVAFGPWFSTFQRLFSGDYPLTTSDSQPDTASPLFVYAGKWFDFELRRL